MAIIKILYVDCRERHSGPSANPPIDWASVLALSEPAVLMVELMDGGVMKLKKLTQIMRMMKSFVICRKESLILEAFVSARNMQDYDVVFLILVAPVAGNQNLSYGQEAIGTSRLDSTY